MKVLVACEYSGRVRDAFAALGHDAWSCDVLDTDAPGNHIKGDIYGVINFNERWDLIIAHPPCTALAVSGNSTYAFGKKGWADRQAAARWTERLWVGCMAVADKVCFENPVGVLPRMTSLPKPSYVQPYQFGHAESKRTGLFLCNLPPLRPTNDVEAEYKALPPNVGQRLHYLPPSADRAKLRSLTYQGIADAMAAQWGAA
jgi:hypothetical protein